MNEIYSYIFNQLKAGVTFGVYDYVPNNISPNDYPFCRVDIINVKENDTETKDGFLLNLQVVCYSRYKGYKEINDMNDLIHSILHNQTMKNTTNYGISLITETMRNVIIDNDVNTRISTQRFNVFFEPL
jgi:hypothetical protein